MNILKKTICGAFLLGFSLSSYADERCYVSEVMSGNTFQCTQKIRIQEDDCQSYSCIKNETISVKVTLDGVTAPAKKSHHWEASKKALADLVLNQWVYISNSKNQTDIISYANQSQHVTCLAHPTYGMCFEVTDIGLEMLQNGHAFSSIDKEIYGSYREAENKAQASKMGIWSAEYSQIPIDN